MGLGPVGAYGVQQAEVVDVLGGPVGAYGVPYAGVVAELLALLLQQKFEGHLEPCAKIQQLK